MMVDTLCEIEPLTWDSTFFRYKVGRVLLPRDSEMQEEVARDVISVAKKSGYKLVYALCSSESVQPNLANMEELGYRFVGGKREYQKKMFVSIADDRSDFSSIKECHQLSKPLLDLAFQSGSLSRFKLDRDFVQNEFERLYTEWLNQSVCENGKISTFIFGEKHAPCGFVTVERDGVSSRIGLFAVDQNSRRLGVGSILEMYVEKWAIENGCERLLVATQAENHAACVFYEKCGFHLVSETSIFHLWI